MRSNPNETLPNRTVTHVPVGSQVTVTIGRNRPTSGGGQKPMTGNQWHDFQATITHALRNLFAPVAEFGPFSGEGQWEGVTEESAVFIVITSYPASPDEVDVMLAKIASWFGQDAIAWSYGPNLLATKVGE